MIETAAALETNLTLVQGVHLVGLIPSLFVAGAIVVWMRSRLTEAMVPAGFFLSLAAGFLLPLLPLQDLQATLLSVIVQVVQSTIPAWIYLLILQCVQHRTPRLVYWLIFALPLVGGSSFIYLASLDDRVCVWPHACLASESVLLLYQMFAACAVFLLLMVQMGKHTTDSQSTGLIPRSHRYWLMVSLIGLSLCVLAADLMRVADLMAIAEHQLIVAVLRISFIYLVLTSLFRVFDLVTQAQSVAKPNPYRDRPISDVLMASMVQLMEQDKLYREMGFSREMMAERLQVGEHVISRTINQAFAVNFNEYVNRYRIAEAKQRLEHESVLVTVIAFEVGFSSIASFNRVFKTLVGCSPTEYRQRFQKESEASA